jgi:hypothetical protein
VGFGRLSMVEVCIVKAMRHGQNHKRVDYQWLKMHKHNHGWGGAYRSCQNVKKKNRSVY